MKQAEKRGLKDSFLTNLIHKEIIMISLENKTALITGASAGIGLAVAEAFAKAKAKLILCARRLDKLQMIADELQKKYSIDVIVLQLDVRDGIAVKETLSKLSDQQIDILVNNAGMAKGFEKLFEGNSEDWDEMIDTNVKGLLYVTRQVLPMMVKAESGHIVNLGSTAGHEVYPNGNVYCSTKYAVKALTQAIRMETLDKNIKVSTVDPGMVETEFSKVRFSGDEQRAKNVYKGVDALTAEDIADAILYCVTRPAHVNISEVIITPTQQASSNFVYRK